MASVFTSAAELGGAADSMALLSASSAASGVRAMMATVLTGRTASSDAWPSRVVKETSSARQATKNALPVSSARVV
jgi:hypothetical protein